MAKEKAFLLGGAVRAIPIDLARTKSSFYHDGYKDARDGKPESPPDTPVYRAEYLRGYDDGCSKVVK